MSERSEITLPSDPLLRALALYGMGAVLALLLLTILVRLLSLPSWLGSVAFATVILGFPVVAVAAWMRERRR
jgi:hypothetical protein